MTLSQKQKRFANEYLIDFNKIRAARAAGYCTKNAEQRANKTAKKTTNLLQSALFTSSLASHLPMPQII